MLLEGNVHLPRWSWTCVWPCKVLDFHPVLFWAYRLEPPRRRLILGLSTLHGPGTWFARLLCHPEKKSCIYFEPSVVGYIIVNLCLVVQLDGWKSCIRAGLPNCQNWVSLCFDFRWKCPIFRPRQNERAISPHHSGIQKPWVWVLSSELSFVLSWVDSWEENIPAKFRKMRTTQQKWLEKQQFRIPGFTVLYCFHKAQSTLHQGSHDHCFPEIHIHCRKIWMMIKFCVCGFLFSGII